MRRQIRIILATLACLVLIDAAVALVLATAAPQSLVQFFDYGRSVPGKLAAWRDSPEARGNLQAVAWMPDILRDSAAAFAAEPADRPPVIRVYGMSFVNQIAHAAADLDPSLTLDTHGGPSAPPNFTYAVFLDDRPNRRAGDIAVLGILSSSVPAMASFSNSSWAFEQPAPFTYPIFRPDGDKGLNRMDPLLSSFEQQQAIVADPSKGREWQAQRRAEDRLYSRAADTLSWLDVSPFARLVRRAIALGAISRQEAAVLAHPDGAPYPYAEALRRMVLKFAEIARSDGQVPVVFLIQGRDPGDPELAALLRSTLEEADIPYLATVDHQDPRDPRAFMGDGHYRHDMNAIFGQAFLDLPPVQTALAGNDSR